MYYVHGDKHVAEDMLQEVFIKVWEKAPMFDSNKGIAISWMTTIVKNHAFDYFRKCKVRPLLTEEATYEGIEYASMDRSQEQRQWQTEQLTLFKTLLNGLTNNQQQVITRSIVYGYSHREISEQLHIPLGTVKAWIRRHLVAIKAQLAAFKYVS